MGKESMQNRKPMILVLAGPNGSGKSTITTFFDKTKKTKKKKKTTFFDKACK